MRSLFLILILPVVSGFTAGVPVVHCDLSSCSSVAMRMPWEPIEVSDDGKKAKPVEKKLSLDGLMQVMAMGAGAPMLGDLKKVNLNKPEAEGGAALQFELEANNFNLDDRGSYFNDGWVAEDDGAPGFFENLMSGGKLQREWDQKRKSGK